MKNKKVELVPLEADDREQFILDNQWSFKYGAMMEFGERDDHTDDDGEIISRKTIERCIDDPENETYRIVVDGEKVGGVILKINKETHHNELEILFVSPDVHSKGIGYGAWLAVEALHPETEVWETCTPYFEKRNIHFYVNKCGFHIDQFWCEYFQPENNLPDDEERDPDEGPDEMFRFVKVMNRYKEDKTLITARDTFEPDEARKEYAKEAEKEITLDELIGKVFLVGITYYTHDNKYIEQKQFCGTVTEVNKMFIRVKQKDGTEFTLPPDLSSTKRARKGEYKLRSTGEIIVDPDFLATWSLTKAE